MTAFGRTRPRIVRISSEFPCPDTCTGAISWWSTSAPPLASRLIVSWTRSSFPGTGFADRITVSPRSMVTAGWSLYAIRVSADIGSPWLPVQRIMASCGASSSSSDGRMKVSSGASRYPRLRAMLRFFRIERPMMQTLRPVSTATSTACCIRCTFDAKLATSTRPWRAGMIWRKASPTSRSEPVKPGRSAFVESPSIRSTPRFPMSARRPTSVRNPSTGVWSSL